MRATRLGLEFVTVSRHAIAVDGLREMAATNGIAKAEVVALSAQRSASWRIPSVVLGAVRPNDVSTCGPTIRCAGLAEASKRAASGRMFRSGNTPLFRDSPIA